MSKSKQPITRPQGPIGERLDRAAASQRGVVSADQLRASAIGRHNQTTAIRSGTLIRVHPGVFRTAGTVMSVRRQLVAACLSAGGEAVASHRAALWIWMLKDDPPPIEITISDRRHPTPRGSVVHRSTDLVDAHTTTRRGVPVTKPARTLVDVGRLVHPHEFSEAIERALYLRLTTVAGLRTMLDEVGRRGRNGAGVLRTYLDERALGDMRPESVLEPLMARICKDHGIGEVEYQQSIKLDGRRVRPDFLVRRAKLAIEIDGLAHHGTRDALDNDLTRQNLLIVHGYLVLRYTTTHLRDPSRVASEIIRTASRRIDALRAEPNES